MCVYSSHRPVTCTACGKYVHKPTYTHAHTHTYTPVYISIHTCTYTSLNTHTSGIHRQRRSRVLWAFTVNAHIGLLCRISSLL